MLPVLVYTIKIQPKTGKYALRDGKAVLLGVFDTYNEAEQNAEERYATTRTKRTRPSGNAPAPNPRDLRPLRRATPGK